MLNTVIEIQYKKYTENVIVTEQNLDDVLLHLLSDKDIVDYDYVVEGDINLEDEIVDLACNFYNTAPSKAKTIHKMENRLYEMQSISYWKTDAQAIKHFEDIDKLEKRIQGKINKLTNLESLFIQNGFKKKY